MIDFDTYIKMGEPGGKERAEAWKTAIGLQAVDGLKTSEYLNETAAKHIEGDITIEQVKELIDVQSSFTDWLNNTNVRAELNQKIFFCLVKAGYLLQYNDEVFEQVMEQVENFKKHN
ncbi:MAG: DUF3387 domain-containing protein [Bacteroidales bacterium]|nr:DUF3387 domain-containing protein [Bacteroidales bacterium]